MKHSLEMLNDWFKEAKVRINKLGDRSSLRNRKKTEEK